MRKLLKAATALAVAGVATVVCAGPALAAPGDRTARAACAEGSAPVLTWTEPTQQYEYGEWWYFQATTEAAYTVTGPWSGSAFIEGAPADSVVSSTYEVHADCRGHLTATPGSTRPLGVGEYALTGEYVTVNRTEVYPTDAPARLIIEPAAIGIQARIVADPSNPRNAVVTAAFTGPFVQLFTEAWGSTAYPSAPITPEGTWHIRIVDASGDLAHEISVARAATDDVLAVTGYWADPAAGEYTVTASFSTSGESAQNFSVADSEPFAFTATGPPPGVEPTASPAPTIAPAASDRSETVPLLVPLLAGVLTAGLLALVIVQAVHTIRNRTIPVEDPAEDIGEVHA
jgi:hypothetical protein